MEWYRGPTLLEFLETAPVAGGVADGPLRLPVQYVIRSGGQRAYAGQIAGGVGRVGGEVGGGGGAARAGAPGGPAGAAGAGVSRRRRGGAGGAGRATGGAAPGGGGVGGPRRRPLRAQAPRAPRTRAA